ncbi:MAG: malonyl-CoA decarboxylase family protein [Aliidongia sp.]
MAAPEPVLTEEERAALGGDPAKTDSETLLGLLTGTEAWWESETLAATLQQPVSRLAAVFLTHAEGPKGVGDPVARFHLGNGARLERINWLGNASPRGMRESFGIMVNYLYDLNSIEANHEAFVRDGTVVRGAAVEALLAPPRRTPPKRRAG